MEKVKTLVEYCELGWCMEINLFKEILREKNTEAIEALKKRPDVIRKYIEKLEHEEKYETAIDAIDTLKSAIYRSDADANEKKNELIRKTEDLLMIKEGGHDEIYGHIDLFERADYFQEEARERHFEAAKNLLDKEIDEIKADKSLFDYVDMNLELIKHQESAKKGMEKVKTLHISEIVTDGNALSEIKLEQTLRILAYPVDFTALTKEDPDIEACDAYIEEMEKELGIRETLRKIPILRNFIPEPPEVPECAKKYIKNTEDEYKDASLDEVMQAFEETAKSLDEEDEEERRQITSVNGNVAAHRAWVLSGILEKEDPLTFEELMKFMKGYVELKEYIRDNPIPVEAKKKLADLYSLMKIKRNADVKAIYSKDDMSYKELYEARKTLILWGEKPDQKKYVANNKRFRFPANVCFDKEWYDELVAEEQKKKKTLQPKTSKIGGIRSQTVSLLNLDLIDMVQPEISKVKNPNAELIDLTEKTVEEFYGDNELYKDGPIRGTVKREYTKVIFPNGKKSIDSDANKEYGLGFDEDEFKEALIFKVPDEIKKKTPGNPEYFLVRIYKDGAIGPKYITKEKIIEIYKKMVKNGKN